MEDIAYTQGSVKVERFSAGLSSRVLCLLPFQLQKVTKETRLVTGPGCTLPHKSAPPTSAAKPLEGNPSLDDIMCLGREQRSEVITVSYASSQ